MAHNTREEREDILKIVKKHMNLYDAGSAEELVLKNVEHDINLRTRSFRNGAKARKLSEMVETSTCKLPGCNKRITFEQFSRNINQEYCSTRCSALARESQKKWQKFMNGKD